MSILVPGDISCSGKEGSSGIGTVLRRGDIRATMVGKLVMEPPATAKGKKRVNIVSDHQTAKEFVLKDGDIVYGKVSKITYNQAFVDILHVGDHELPFVAKAVIRRENIRENEIDKVAVHEFLKPLDIVRASVLSLGDNNQYYLTIAKSGLGVVVPQITIDPEI